MPAADHVNLAVVQAMSAAWERGDVDAVLAFCDDDCHFRLAGHRVEEPPVIGVKKMREALAVSGDFSSRKVSIRIRDLLALHPAVVTSEQHLLDDQQEAWVIGEYFVEYGRIREWVNYEVVAPRARQRVAGNYGMFRRAAV
jgi:limonene-1,2-epoxide hydrolase